jgi:phosphoserine phosphatase
MNIDKLKEDFEFYYRYSKVLESVKDLQDRYIGKLEKHNSKTTRIREYV